MKTGRVSIPSAAMLAMTVAVASAETAERTVSGARNTLRNHGTDSGGATFDTIPPGESVPPKVIKIQADLSIWALLSHTAAVRVGEESRTDSPITRMSVLPTELAAQSEYAKGNL